MDLTSTDMILIAQEMRAAFRKYAESAENLSAMEPLPGQFANAISGQRQMADWCAEVAQRAAVLSGIKDLEDAD
jgi:hypothetical protein